MQHARRILPISEAKALKLAVDAKLTDAELLTLILYTGPMFQVREKRAHLCMCLRMLVYSLSMALFHALTCVAGLQLHIAPLSC